MAKKVLEVKDLAISFKTDNGLVKAVRNVSFDLSEGETLCIVGESGSGKSVTSKAIMGILSSNAVVENGSIMYQGENLLEVSEEEFHKIRGHKIGMIFQDPLSSLNPIVRIGKQITEATIINSNKLKKMYEELISSDLTKYKNTLTKMNIKLSKAKEKLEDDLAQNKGNKEKCKELKLEYKNDVKNIKETYEKLLPDLKLKLKAAKASAKAEVKEYKAKVTAEHKELRAPLTAELKAEKQTALNQIAPISLNLMHEALYSVKHYLIKLFKRNKGEKYEAFLSKHDEYVKAYNEKMKVRIEILDKIKAEDTRYIDLLKITRREAKARALEIMGEVGIPQPEKRFRQYPFEFSGGMRQRIVIAIALTASPEILICDEPTTALDVTIQAKILELIKKIQAERHIACIFITHDLGVVANMADRVAVMYAGKIVEYGTAYEIFFEPKHPYTWALLASIPDVDSKERLDAIPGTPPNMIYPPKGDAFALRSKYAMKIDFEHQPPFFKVSDTHYAATWLLHPNAPKVEMPKIVSERIRIALENQPKEEASHE